MILDEHLRFLIINGMLNGYTNDEIVTSLQITHEKFASLIGFESYKDITDLFCTVQREVKLSDIERFLLKIFSLKYYCCSFFEKKEGEYIVFTLEQIRDDYLQKPLANNILEEILVDVLPEIREGNKLLAKDGVMYIPSKYLVNFKRVCLDTFKKYIYGNSILNRNLFNKIVHCFDITSYSTLEADTCQQLIISAAKNGYHLCALNQLVERSLVDYISIFSAFKAILKVVDNGNQILILTQDDHSNSKLITISSSVFTMMAKTPSMFESCKYSKGYIMILTNTGYKQLILHEEATVY